MQHGRISDTDVAPSTVIRFFKFCLTDGVVLLARMGMYNAWSEMDSKLDMCAVQCAECSLRARVVYILHGVRSRVRTSEGIVSAV